VAALAWPLLQGYHAAIRHEWLTAFVAFGISFPALLIVLGTCKTICGRVLTRCTWDSTGTTFWPDRGFTRVLVVAALVLIPAGVLFVVLMPLGVLDLPADRGLQAVTGPLLIGSATVAAVVGVFKAWQRGGIGYLTLSPEGIDDANILATKSYDWDDMAEIQGSPSKGKGRNTIVLVLRDGDEAAIQGAHGYVPSGVPLYWMVQYYFSHPDMRSELTDGRAVERLNRGLFEFTQW
jgi:hypothetical protein